MTRQLLENIKTNGRLDMDGIGYVLQKYVYVRWLWKRESVVTQEVAIEVSVCLSVCLVCLE